MRSWKVFRITSQYGGMVSSSVIRFDGPTIETAAA